MRKRTPVKPQKQTPKKPQVRNKFEQSVAERLPVGFEYESTKLPFTQQRNYIPDFTDATARIVVESKGRFTSADRTKMRLVKQQHPDMTFVLCLQTPNVPITKGSKLTYEQWAVKAGFTVCTKDTLAATIKTLKEKQHGRA